MFNSTEWMNNFVKLESKELLRVTSEENMVLWSVDLHVAYKMNVLQLSSVTKQK